MTVTTIDDPSDLSRLYADAPNGVRANMIFSADGAAAFRGRAGTLSCPADQNLLRDLRAFADVVLVGSSSACRRERRHVGRCARSAAVGWTPGQRQSASSATKLHGCRPADQ